MTRVGVLWLRVSDDKGQDVEGQERELRAVAQRLGLSIPEELVFRMQDETAHSVFKGDPPEKKQVLELARRRKFDVLLVWSLDRWSRRRKDGLREIYDQLRPCNVEFYSHEEPFLTNAGIPEWVKEQLASTMLFLAEEDSKRKSRRVRVRYETNRNRAEAGGGKAKWGRGRIPTEADRERVAELYGKDYSTRAIAQELGIPKSTVGDIVKALGIVRERSLRTLKKAKRAVSETSVEVGGSVSPEPAERPRGTPRTDCAACGGSGELDTGDASRSRAPCGYCFPVRTGQNSIPGETSGRPSSDKRAPTEAVSDGGA